jgi:hypothetical protein
MIKVLNWATVNTAFVDNFKEHGATPNIMKLVRYFEPKEAEPKDLWVMLRLATNEIEIVSGTELTDLEQRLMKVHATKA